MICYECQRGFLCGECIIQSTTTIDEASDDQNDRRTPRSLKRDAALKDQQSTGRKRAARLYPLSRDLSCEWANASVSNPMGGGTKPVTVGCDRLQLNRHHGPDKNTLNNDAGNVWRICSHHHARWHADNDPDYIPGKPVRD